MKKTILWFSILLIGSAVIISCKTDNAQAKFNGETANPELGIDSSIPSNLGHVYTSNFNRYTKVITPNGGEPCSFVSS